MAQLIYSWDDYPIDIPIDIGICFACSQAKQG